MLDRCAVKAVSVLVLTSMLSDLRHKLVKVIFRTMGPGYNGHCISRSPLYKSQGSKSQLGL